MPYKSMAQSRFMHAVEPDIAERWDKETSPKKFKSLKDHIKGMKNKKG
jgi:hypothetical protein